MLSTEESYSRYIVCAYIFCARLRGLMYDQVQEGFHSKISPSQSRYKNLVNKFKVSSVKDKGRSDITPIIV